MTWVSGSPWRALGCLLLAALVHCSAPPPDGLRTGLALFVLIGGLWMTQALHLSVTALLVPLLAVLAGLMDLRSALARLSTPSSSCSSAASRSPPPCSVRDWTGNWPWPCCAPRTLRWIASSRAATPSCGTRAYPY
jgi:hypothetical protein